MWGGSLSRKSSVRHAVRWTQNVPYAEDVTVFLVYVWVCWFCGCWFGVFFLQLNSKEFQYQRIRVSCYYFKIKGPSHYILLRLAIELVQKLLRYWRKQYLWGTEAISS